MPNKGASKRLGVAVITAIVMAVLLAALIAGLWYFLRGRKEKRTPETPQTVSLPCLRGKRPT
jgi:hypothetical protein